MTLEAIVKPLVIGQPRLEWGTNLTRTCVQLYYLRNDQVVNLYSGRHPTLYLEESDIELSIEYRVDKNKKRVDLGKTIEFEVIRQVNALLCAHAHQVEPAERAHQYGYYKLEYVCNGDMKGLQLDTNAIVHEKWFR